VSIHLPTLKSAFKRGALIAAANGQVIGIQLIAESLFKLLLLVPIVGGIILVVLLLGTDFNDLLDSGIRGALPAVLDALTAQPPALLAFVLALLVVVVGGSCVMFFVKGGTVAILVRGHRQAGAIDELPVTLANLRRASAFSMESFSAGCWRLFRRYLVLGLSLILVYGVAGALYLAVVLGGVRDLAEGARVMAWTLTTALASTMLVIGITLINLLYLLVQIAIAADDLSLPEAIRQVVRLIRAETRQLAGIFALVFLILVLALAASLLATAALGLIAFVPLFWLAALPLQFAAWLLRALLFQYLGLTALGAYLDLYRSFADSRQAAAGSVASAEPPAMRQPA
jgi:hypothetical protein